VQLRRQSLRSLFCVGYYHGPTTGAHVTSERWDADPDGPTGSLGQLPALMLSTWVLASPLSVLDSGAEPADFAAAAWPSGLTT
jgi:hypothetical protein